MMMKGIIFELYYNIKVMIKGILFDFFYQFENNNIRDILLKLYKF